MFLSRLPSEIPQDKYIWMNHRYLYRLPGTELRTDLEVDTRLYLQSSVQTSVADAHVKHKYFSYL